MAEGPEARRVLLPAAAAGLLLFGLGLVEVRFGLGGVTGLVGVIPVALSLAVGGPGAAGFTALIAVSAMALTLGSAAAVTVSLRHVLPGLALGVALARRHSLILGTLVVGTAHLAGLALVVWAYLPGADLRDLLGRQMAAHVADLAALQEQLGLRGDPGVVVESARLVARTLEVAGPAVVLVGLLLTALVNYLGARVIFRREGFAPFAAEAVPDQLVWGVVAGGALALSGHETAGLVGLNLLVVLTVFYAIQGLAVLRHFFQRVRVPRALQGVSFGVFALQPLLLVAVACLGLSDLWADFRKIRHAPTSA